VEGEEGKPVASSRRSSSYQRSEVSCFNTAQVSEPSGVDKCRAGRSSVGQRISNDTAKELNSGQAGETIYS